MHCGPRVLLYREGRLQTLLMEIQKPVVEMIKRLKALKCLICLNYI